MLEDGSFILPQMESKRSYVQNSSILQPSLELQHSSEQEPSSERIFDEQESPLKEIAYNSSSTKNKENLTNFQIPWEKVPTDVIETLKAKKDVSLKMNKLSNILVDELRVLSDKIPMSVIKSVAANVSAQFPDSFIIKDDKNNVISSEPITLINTMKNRVNFLNRAPKRPASENNPIIPIKERRKADTLNASCSNWQPNVSLTENQSNKVKQQQLIHWYKSKSDSPQVLESIADFMKITYPAQRNFLNNRINIPKMVDVQQNWPYLFVKPHMFHHLDLLLSKDTNSFERNFNATKEKLSTILISKKLITNTAEDDIIIGIAKYFKENINFLFKKIEVSFFKFLFLSYIIYNIKTCFFYLSLEIPLMIY